MLFSTCARPFLAIFCVVAHVRYRWPVPRPERCRGSFGGENMVFWLCARPFLAVFGFFGRHVGAAAARAVPAETTLPRQPERAVFTSLAAGTGDFRCRGGRRHVNVVFARFGRFRVRGPVFGRCPQPPRPPSLLDSALLGLGTWPRLRDNKSTRQRLGARRGDCY